MEIAVRWRRQVEVTWTFNGPISDRCLCSPYSTWLSPPVSINRNVCDFFKKIWPQVALVIKGVVDRKWRQHSIPPSRVSSSGHLTCLSISFRSKLFDIFVLTWNCYWDWHFGVSGILDPSMCRHLNETLKGISSHHTASFEPSSILCDARLNRYAIARKKNHQNKLKIKKSQSCYIPCIRGGTPIKLTAMKVSTFVKVIHVRKINHVNFGGYILRRLVSAKSLI